MKIKGKVKYLSRVKEECPADNIHVCGSDGKIKGSHLIQIDDKKVFHGNVAFYWDGMKVFFSFLTLRCTSYKKVLEIYKRMKRLHKLGICVKPFEIKQIKVKFEINNKILKAQPYAIVVQHIHHPDIMEDFALGYPYNWDCVDYAGHNPNGFEKFYKWAMSEMTAEDRKAITCFRKEAKQRLGDILFCTKTKRWWLVDV